MTKTLRDEVCIGWVSTILLIIFLLWSSVGWAEANQREIVDCVMSHKSVGVQNECIKNLWRYNEPLKPCTKELGECIKEVEQADGR